jgi:hypothetical protein
MLKAVTVSWSSWVWEVIYGLYKNKTPGVKVKKDAGTCVVSHVVPSLITNGPNR